MGPPSEKGGIPRAEAPWPLGPNRFNGAALREGRNLNYGVRDLDIDVAGFNGAALREGRNLDDYTDRQMAFAASMGPPSEKGGISTPALASTLPAKGFNGAALREGRNPPVSERT